MSQHGHELVFRPVGRLGSGTEAAHLVARGDLVGHVERHHEDALDGAVHVPQRREHEIEVHRVERAASVPIDPYRRFLSDVLNPRAQHALQQRLERLIRKLRQRVGKRPPEHFVLGASPHLAGQRIRQLDHVLRPLQDDDRRGRLHEERPKMLFLKLRLAARARKREERTDACGKLARIERLGDVVVRACAQPGDPRVLAGAGRQHEDRHGPRARVAPERPQQREPVEAGHHDIRHHQIRRLGAHRVQRGPAVRSGLDVPVT